MRLVSKKSKYLLPLFNTRFGLDVEVDIFVVAVVIALLVMVGIVVGVAVVGMLAFRRFPLKEINAISSSILVLLFELDACSVTNKEALTKFVVVCVKNTTKKPTTTIMENLLTENIF